MVAIVLVNEQPDVRKAPLFVLLKQRYSGLADRAVACRSDSPPGLGSQLPAPNSLGSRPRRGVNSRCTALRHVQLTSCESPCVRKGLLSVNRRTELNRIEIARPDGLRAVLPSLHLRMKKPASSFPSSSSRPPSFFSFHFLAFFQ